MGKKLLFAFFLLLISTASAQNCPYGVKIAYAPEFPVCEGTEITFSVPNLSSEYDVQWFVNGSAVSSENPLPARAFDDDDLVKVEVTSKALPSCFVSDEIRVEVSPIISGRVTIQASQANICPGETVTFSISSSSAFGAATYNWYVNGNVTSHGNSYLANGLDTGDKVQLEVIPQAKCAAPFFSNEVVIATKEGPPAIPQNFEGPAEICSGETVTYSVPEVSGATKYLWQLPAGWRGSSQGSSIEITARGSGGTISVEAENACGKSDPQTLFVSVKPGLTDEITGPATICSGSSATYSVPFLEDTNYTWTLPQGWTGRANDNSIEVLTATTGGEIKVEATNSCGTFEKSLAVDVNGEAGKNLPEITGKTEVCSGELVSFAIDPDPNIVNYNWILPTGWTSTDDLSSEEILVEVGTISGNVEISIAIEDRCGNLHNKKLPVTVDGANFPSEISGNFQICDTPQTLKYNVSETSGINTYHWTFPADWQILSGVGTHAVEVNPGVSSGEIKISMTGNCGSKTLSSRVDISRRPPGQIGMITSNLNAALCPPKEVQFQVAPVFGASGFNWKLPPGWEILEGENTNSIKVLVSGSTSYKKTEKISVSAFNGCGTSQPSELAVVMDNYIKVDLGPDLIVCETQERINITGKIAFDELLIPNLTTSGTGILDLPLLSPNSEVLIGYTPSLEDLEKGFVVVTLETNRPPGACGPVRDEITIKFQDESAIFEYFEVSSLQDQVLSCGTTEANLEVVATPLLATKEMMRQVQWEWKVTSGQDEETFSFSKPFSQKTNFTASPGNYELQWILSHPQICGEISGTVGVNFSHCSNLDFDGDDDLVVLPNPFNEVKTWEAWVRPEKSSGVIFSNRSQLGNGYELLLQNNVPVFRWKGGEVRSPFAVFPNDRWYHFSVIAEEDSVSLYIDGLQVQNTPVTNIPNSIQPLHIGGPSKTGNSEGNFSGWIEEVRLWNRPLTVDQVRFLMNQRLNTNGQYLGAEIQMDIPDGLNSSNLEGYYQLITNSISEGITPDLSLNARHGKLLNMYTNQENSAPLPYVSAQDGEWMERSTWSQPQVWDFPNSTGITGENIDWNIVRTRHNISSGAKNITVLGLISEEKNLKIVSPTGPQNERNRGQLLRITHYLLLDGLIDLVGESQLIQNEGSVVDEKSKGFLERDQQGRASSYNYNYWSSPVSTQTKNGGYSVIEVLKDGTDSANPVDLIFGDSYHFADGAPSIPKKISNYWLNKFNGTANDYGSWKFVGSKGKLKAAEGYSMKGTTGTSALKDRQNYTFKGKPNNGDIELTIGPNQNYLIGNPYPSALDANEFIMDNLSLRRNGKNIFNGTLYFWSHFAGATHYLQEYIGGYATYNLSGGIIAISNDERINANDSVGGKVPERYIPVGQGFFVNTVLPEELKSSTNPIAISGGTIQFRNSQRIFKREIDENNDGKNDAVFHKQEKKTNKSSSPEDSREKMWIRFKSPLGYHREILVTADSNATEKFDLGYDAPLIEENLEDMYWNINGSHFVIQGVPAFDKERELQMEIRISQKGKFTIDLKEQQNIPPEKGVFLKDSLLQVIHDLREGPYATESDPGVFPNRFSIVFEAPPAKQSADLLLEGQSLEVMYLNRSRELLIQNPDNLNIYSVSLHNLLGQQVQSYVSLQNESELRLPVKEFSSGVYVVKVQSEKGRWSKNVLLE